MTLHARVYERSVLRYVECTAPEGTGGGLNETSDPLCAAVREIYPAKEAPFGSDSERRGGRRVTAARRQAILNGSPTSDAFVALFSVHHPSCGAMMFVAVESYVMARRLDDVRCGGGV